MTMPDDGLRPEEFAEAASAAIADAQGCSVREAGQVLAQGGLAGVCAPEDDGGVRDRENGRAHEESGTREWTAAGGLAIIVRPNPGPPESALP